MTGGPKGYESINKNLEGGFPSVKTAQRRIYKYKKPVIEGKFRFKELKEHLLERSLPFYVWVGEDATRITGKIQYNKKRDQISGFTPKLDQNSLPIIDSFEASSGNLIKKYFDENPMSNYAYVIMAQPLCYKAPAFCLCIYGSDSRFTSQQVSRRWKWMLAEASKHEISILGFSSDGDTRCLKAMISNALHDPKRDSKMSDFYSGFFIIPPDRTVAYIQDVTHILTKLRTRLLNGNVVLMMGDYVASSSHLREVISQGIKEIHCLTLSDLEASDKMNFDAAVKIINPEILPMLDEIPDTLATKIYLQIMKLVHDSYLSEIISPSDRVYSIWKATFMLRLWRKSLYENTRSVSKNFISSNCYSCIELNAHAMVTCINYFRDQNIPRLFLPWLFSSQCCESFFRTARYMTNTCNTVVNFSILELLYRVNRINLLSQIPVILKGKYVFPREDKNNKVSNLVTENLYNLDLPNEKQIQDIITRAWQDAVKKMNCIKLNIQVNENFPMAPHEKLSEIKIDDEEDDLSLAQNSNSMLHEERNTISKLNSEIIQDIEDDTEYNEENTTNVDPNDIDPKFLKHSPYTLYESEGKCRIIRKSTLCWQLSDGKSKLSNDRLQRVKASEVVKKTEKSTFVEFVTKSDHVSIGQWCAFQGSKPSNILIGKILNFHYCTETSFPSKGKTKGKTKKKLSKFHSKKALIWKNEILCNENSKKPLEKNKKFFVKKHVVCLSCPWYTIKDSQLILSIKKAETVNIENYICTLPPPTYENNVCFYNPKIISDLRKYNN